MGLENPGTIHEHHLPGLATTDDWMTSRRMFSCRMFPDARALTCHLDFLGAGCSERPGQTCAVLTRRRSVIWQAAFMSSHWWRSVLMPQDQSLARVTAIAAARTRAWPWASSHPCQLDDMDEVGSLYIPQDVNAAFLSSLVVTYRKRVFSHLHSLAYRQSSG